MPEMSCTSRESWTATVPAACATPLPEPQADAAPCSPGSDGAYQYAVIESGGDLRPLVKDMNAALHGRGGGRDGFAQGSAACTAEDIRSFFQNR